MIQTDVIDLFVVDLRLAWEYFSLKETSPLPVKCDKYIQSSKKVDSRYTGYIQYYDYFWKLCNCFYRSP